MYFVIKLEEITAILKWCSHQCIIEWDANFYLLACYLQQNQKLSFIVRLSLFSMAMCFTASAYPQSQTSSYSLKITCQISIFRLSIEIFFSMFCLSVFSLCLRLSCFLSNFQCISWSSLRRSKFCGFDQPFAGKLKKLEHVHVAEIGNVRC